jgi:hypothetical protein
MSRSSAVIISMCVTLLVAVLTTTAPAGAQPGTVSVSASVNGHDVTAADANTPLRLQPDQSVDLAISLTNNTSQAVNVRRVVLDGRVLGLSFFSYASTVALDVAPGGRGALHYPLDLTGLQGQATGLLAGDLTVTDAAGHPIGIIPTVFDVRGSLMSVYGLFGIALAVLTALALLDAALAIARRRLSANRWQRGLRVLAPGIGIGLMLAFSASVARLWVPSTAQWLQLAGLSAAGFFALGYLSPAPNEQYDEDLLEDEDLDDEPDTATAAGTEHVSAKQPAR